MSDGETKINQALRGLFFGLILAIWPLERAHATEYVIFRIDGTIENLKLGQALEEGDILDIPQDVTLQLISKSGEIVTLRGPGVATVTQEPEDRESETALQAISSLLFDEERYVKIVGGSRSVGSDTQASNNESHASSTNPLRPFLSGEKDYCVASEAPFIRRKKEDADWTVEIRQPGSSQVAALDWPSGQEELSLSPVTGDGNARYLIRVPGYSQEIRVHMVDRENLSFVEQLALMAEQGCKAQALQVLMDKASRE